jgi:hypothetical protein
MLRNASKGLIATLSIGLLGAVAPATAAQAAEPASLDASVVSANGSGCPNGTATARPLSDGSSLAIDFEGYYAWSGGNAPTTAFRTNCQFAISISQPAGWTYAIDGANYSGFAVLDSGVTGVEAAHYYFQGDAATVTGSHTFAGPYTGTWNASDAFGSDELVYAPCDAERLLNVNTEVRVTPQANVPEPSAVWLDPSFTLHVTWKAC